MKMQGNQCVVPNQQTQPQPAPISMGRYPIAGSISQDYGVRWVVNSNKTHTGVDIPAAQGTQVPSMSSGYVAEIRELGGSWGKAVIIQESGGSAKGYLHVNPKVSKGERVSTGQIIGAVWEDHLHYNVCTEVYLCWRGALPTSEPDPNYPNDPLFFNGPFLRP
jgi:murein DD-endopeptidase MepM/ murein hydrolase activator NlpD